MSPAPRRRASSHMTHVSVPRPAGRFAALLCLTTRPSALAITPSSSAQAVTGSTTWRVGAVSERKKSTGRGTRARRTLCDHAVVGEGDEGVVADAEQAPDLPAAPSARPSPSSRCRPGSSDSSMPQISADTARCSGFVMRAAAGQQVGLLAVLAAALAVALAGDRPVAGSGLCRLARWRATRLMNDRQFSTPWSGARCRGRARPWPCRPRPTSCRPARSAVGDAADLGGALGRVGGDGPRTSQPGVGGDEAPRR